MKVWICLNGSELKIPPTPEQVWRSVFCLSVIEHIQPDGQIVLHGTQATFDFDVIGVYLGLTPGDVSADAYQYGMCVPVTGFSCSMLSSIKRDSQQRRFVVVELSIS